VKLEGARGLSRRSFFGAAAATGAALGAEHQDIQSPAGSKRARDAYRIRVDAARLERDAPEPDHIDNGDEGAAIFWWRSRPATSGCVRSAASESSSGYNCSLATVQFPCLWILHEARP
jgi:hypothetical protein